MKQHPLIGYNILKDNAELKDTIKYAVLQHHEKINGKGYPIGLEADKITLFAKILAVVDIYDAL